jgi:hypothetical protein
MRVLDELQQLHGKMRAGLDALDALNGHEAPPMHELSSVRLAVTRASRSRTMLLEQVYPGLIAQADPQERAQLEALRSRATDDIVASAQHIAIWTIREITDRWHDYREASRHLRAGMRERIDREVALLYPLLAQPDALNADIGVSGRG